ncbi:rhodanese-like domain-containing protein [Flavobacteriaceae bacterium SZ-1-7]|uniref:rhodanese-like domain-containing protein n=1 Tax=Tamlana sedimenti TaxID=3134126 RepID=UPI0031287011
MDKKKIAKVLSFRYKIMAAILVVLAGGLVLLPKYQKQEGIKSEALLNHAISPERYISTDQISDKLISRDPSFILVDVRDEASYNDYTLPNAINIPLAKLFDDNSAPYLNQDQFDVVFFSNDNFHADQAWILCYRLGYKNLRVLKGGLNQWFNTIINPKIPSEDMPAEDFELYSTRKAASMFFGVAYQDQNVEKDMAISKPAPKKIITVAKKKKRPVEGGC